MAAALVLLALLASAGADPALLAADNKGPLGFDINELLAKVLAHYDPWTAAPLTPFAVDIPEISAKGSVSNVVVTGVSGLRLRSLALNELGDGKVAVSAALPSIQAVGDYEVTGAINKIISLPLDSAGKFTFALADLHVSLSVQLGISDEGQILLKDFQLPDWNMTDIEVHLGGLFNGDALGNMINDVLHDTLTHIITKAYHDKLTTLITTTVITEGGKFLADLHRDHGHPEFQGADLPPAVPEAGVVAPVRDGSRRAAEPTPPPSSLSSHSAPPVKRTDLLSLVGLDSEELRGLLTFDLAAPQFYPRGALLSADDGEPEDGGSALSLLLSDVREAPVDKPFGVHLAPAQFYPHGELSSQGASSAADKSGSPEGLQGLLAHGVDLRPMGKPTFYKKGHLSQPDASA